MASLSERERNNIRAGVFVTIALLLSMGVVIVLTDAVSALSRATDSYTVTFDVSSGVANLKPGSDVRIGGMRMGKVTSVEPKVEGSTFRQIEVEFNVDSRAPLHADAIILVSAPLIGSDAWLDIPDVGDPASGAPVGNRLQGTSSVGMLTALLGAENADKASEMVENVRLLSAFLAKVPDEYRARIAPVLDDAGAVVRDLRSVHWPHWAGAVDRVMTWAADATPRLEAALGYGHDLLANANQVVTENREPIKSIVSNVQTATGRINTETIDKVHRVLDLGQQGLEQAKATLETLRVDYAGWATNIGEALASANLTAQQLKLASIETRRSPWKLLYRPNADELQHELLYEATRSFALAAADLKATSESVKRILEKHPDIVGRDHEAYRRLERSLFDSLSNYEKAQQKMLDVLVTDTKH